MSSKLYKKRVVVTRPESQACELVAMLHQRGALPLLFPVISIEPVSLTKEIDLQQYDIVAFTSQNAVQMFAKVWQGSLSHLKLAAVGPKTAKAAEDLLQITPSYLPDSFEALALAKVIPAQSRVLLPHGSLSRPDLKEALEKRSCHVTCLEVYRTVKSGALDELQSALQSHAVDAIVFTSPSQAEAFAENLSPDIFSLATRIRIACIGRVTHKKAEDLGFLTVRSPQSHTLDAMLDALEELFYD